MYKIGDVQYSYEDTSKFEFSTITQSKILASDAQGADYFGRAVAIYEDYAIVGAYGDDQTGNSAGAAYIFIRSGTTWSQQAKLVASDAASDDFFGYNVGIYGDYVIVGAYKNDDGGSESGSAYFKVRNNLEQQAKLVAVIPHL